MRCVIVFQYRTVVSLLKINLKLKSFNTLSLSVHVDEHHIFQMTTGHKPKCDYVPKLFIQTTHRSKPKHRLADRLPTIKLLLLNFFSLCMFTKYPIMYEYCCLSVVRKRLLQKRYGKDSQICLNIWSLDVQCVVSRIYERKRTLSLCYFAQNLSFAKFYTYMHIYVGFFVIVLLFNNNRNITFVLFISIDLILLCRGNSVCVGADTMYLSCLSTSSH